MKIKKEGEIITLTESDIKRIVEKKLSLDEGLLSTLKGIGGMFKGSGYSYTKYAYELSGALKELNEELEESIIEVGKIVNKSNKSKMTNVSYDRLSKHVADALDAYKMVIGVNETIIEDLYLSVSNKREDERVLNDVVPQFDRGN
jgi:acetylglutamate kinase